jgi:hypothetical protein
MMDNGKTQKLVDSSELLNNACIVDDSKRDQWKECIPYYRSAMKKVSSKEDFNTAAIVSFQQDFDKYFQIWVKLHSYKGITNYIHMLSSGHISVYLAHWKNLYHHLQQGQEAINSGKEGIDKFIVQNPDAQRSCHAKSREEDNEEDVP